MLQKMELRNEARIERCKWILFCFIPPTRKKEAPKKTRFVCHHKNVVRYRRESIIVPTAFDR